jgi:hypothetical protein
MFWTGWCEGISAWGWLLMALVWGGFLAIVVWAITWLFPRSRARPSGHRDAVRQDAADLLDRRFAPGEIERSTRWATPTVGPAINGGASGSPGGVQPAPSVDHGGHHG